MNKPVGQEVEGEEKMDEAVSLYFAGQSSDDHNSYRPVRSWDLGGMMEEWEGKVYKGVSREQGESMGVQK